MNTTTFPEGASVVLGFGPQPLDWISKAVKVIGKTAVLDPDVARMAGANLAAGTPEALGELRRRLEAGALQAAQQKHPEAPPGATEWLAKGERGMSSEALFTRLSGIDARDGRRSMETEKRDRVAHPFDPADLRRCRLMLEAIPSLAVKLYQAADLSPEWARLIGRWDDLTALMNTECPTWRDATGQNAAETRALMNTILGR